MSKQTIACPWCGDSTNITTQMDAHQGNKWGYAYCSCGTRGPEVRTGYDDAPGAPWRALAMEQWNQRAVAEASPAITVDALRTAVADYMQSEGCGCCRNYEKHRVHKDKLGELLGLPALPDTDDTVYYNFSPYKTPN